MIVFSCWLGIILAELHKSSIFALERTDSPPCFEELQSSLFTESRAFEMTGILLLQ